MTYSYSGPEFQCKPSSGGTFTHGWYDSNNNGTGIMQLLDRMNAPPSYCGIMCFMDARCHGFTSSEDNICTLYGYYPLPNDSVEVGQYYQLYCV